MSLYTEELYERYGYMQENAQQWLKWQVYEQLWQKRLL